MRELRLFQFLGGRRILETIEPFVKVRQLSGNPINAYREEVLSRDGADKRLIRSRYVTLRWVSVQLIGSLCAGSGDKQARKKSRFERKRRTLCD